MIKQGLVHTVTGSGKNKTSSAVGQTIRAVGYGWKVLFVQFNKGDYSGELEAFKRFPEIKVLRNYIPNKIVKEQNKNEEDIKYAQELWISLKEELKTNHYDMIVLDEVLSALCLELITEQQFFRFINKYAKSKSIILTGRIWIDSLYDKVKDISDLFSDIKCVRHWFNKWCPHCRREYEYRMHYCGNCATELETVKARQGIEF